jgi:hypothetical protein
VKATKAADLRIAHSHFPGTSHSLDGFVNVWLSRLLNGSDGIGKKGIFVRERAPVLSQFETE